MNACATCRTNARNGVDDNMDDHRFGDVRKRGAGACARGRAARRDPCARFVTSRAMRAGGVTFMAFLAVVLGVIPAFAQQRFPRGAKPAIRRTTVKNRTPAPPARPVVIEPTAPVANLLSRADEGIQRADWKFTIDCLQRIINSPENSLVRRTDRDTNGNELFESVRRHATRRLASLPPEALRAYRLLYDGRAKRLFDKGITNHDAKALRKLTSRFAMTHYGDDATNLLMSWALDAERLDEVIGLATSALSSTPTGDIARDEIRMKLAAAYALLGRGQEARTMLESIGASAGGSRSADSSLDIAVVLALSPSAYEKDRIVSSWPTVGGSPARRGWMPAVEPILSDTLPWWSALPGGAADSWRPVLDGDSDGQLHLPVGQLATNGSYIFTRTRRGCAAFEIEDLALLWDSQTANGKAQRGVGRNRSTPRVLHVIPTTDAGVAFDDAVAGGISLGHGLVTMISREGRNSYTHGGRDAGRRGLFAWIPRPRFGNRAAQGSQAIAYDAKTGRIAWQRGRTGHPDDPLGGVEFLSTPLAVGNAFWVPFQRQGDLRVVVLDPTDGALIRTVALCSTGRATQVLRRGLHLAAGDGLVFVPSGQGVLFAVDANDYTLRWASRYGALLTNEPAIDQGDTGGWLSSPPIVAGGLLLLTPSSGVELLAFSTADGALQWKSRCPRSAYLFAADHERVWLGGRSMTCLSLATGKPVWTLDIDSTPTGRAVRSENRIYVPTLNELLSLNAMTGEVLVRTHASVRHGALGNLLCFGSSMFSLNPAFVRKLPDLRRSYPSARQEHTNNPEDVVAAVRLAWLELLREEPQRAFDVVAAIPDSAMADGGRAADKLAHVRVEALLAMAGQSGTQERTGEQVLTLLEEAGRAARTSRDRLRCTMAIADQLEALGRYADAFGRLWRLGTSHDGAQTVSWGEHVEGMARTAIALRLRSIAENLTERESDQFRSNALSALALSEGRIGGAASTRDARVRLRAVADLQVVESISQRAMLELAMHHSEQAQYERAEQLFLGCARLSAEATLDIAARMGVSQVFATAAEAGFASQQMLVKSLDTLESRFGALSVPDSVRQAPTLGVDGDKSGLVADWAQTMRAGFSICESSEVTRHVGSLDLQFTDEVVWSVKPPPRGHAPRMVSFGDTLPDMLQDRVVLYSPGDVISCYRAGDGELLWKSSLSLPGAFDESQIIRWQDDERGPRSAVAGGQTAVFNGLEGLFAIGLGTGRRLWSRAFEPPGWAAGHGDAAMAIHNGLLVAMPRAGRLSLMHLVDGSTIWERDLLGESVGTVWMTADQVITADPRLSRVHVFSIEDGQLLARMMFDQPDPHNQLVHLIRTGSLICGPFATSDSEGVVAMNTADGKVAWRLALKKPVVQMFTPQEGFIGIGLLGGDVRIVDALTGRLVLERRVARAHAVLRGVLIDGTLVVQPRTTRGGIRASALVALDVATDTELWRRDDVIPLWRIDRALRVVNGRLPVLMQRTRRDARKGRRVHLAMLDVRTGLGEETELALPVNRQGADLNGDFELFVSANVAVLGTETGIHVLKTIVAEQQVQEGF